MIKKVKKVNPRGCGGQTAPLIHTGGCSWWLFSPPVFAWEILLTWTWFCFWNRCWCLSQTMCDPDQPEKWQVGSLQGNRLPWAVRYCCPHDASSSDSAAPRWHRELWVSACAVNFREWTFFGRARIQLNSLSTGSHSMDPIDLHVLQTQGGLAHGISLGHTETLRIFFLNQLKGEWFFYFSWL